MSRQVKCHFDLHKPLGIFDVQCTVLTCTLFDIAASTTIKQIKKEMEIEIILLTVVLGSN